MPTPLTDNKYQARLNKRAFSPAQVAWLDSAIWLGSAIRRGSTIWFGSTIWRSSATCLVAAFLTASSLTQAVGSSEAPNLLAQQQQQGSSDEFVYLSAQLQRKIQEGDFARALDLARKMLTINQSKNGLNDPGNLELLNNIAWLLQQNGRPAESRSTLEQAIDLAQKNNIVNADYVASLNNLGTLLYSQNDYDSAKTFFEKSITISEKLFGASDIRIARSLRNLGGIYDALGQEERATACYKRALELTRSRQPLNELELAETLSDFGSSLEDKRNFTEAKPLLEESLRIKESKLGQNSFELVEPLNNLAVLELDQNNTARSEDLLSRALRISELAIGQNHIYLVALLNNLGDVKLTSSSKEQAAKYYTRAAAIIDQYLEEQLPNCSFAEQQSLLEAYVPPQISRLLSSARGESLSNSYNEHFSRWKGALINSLGWESKLRTAAISEDAKSKLQRLSHLRAELGGWYLQAGTMDYELWKKKNDELTGEKEKLERAIFQSTQSAAPRENTKLISSAVENDESFIDIYKYNLYDKSIAENPHYAAIIIRPGLSNTHSSLNANGAGAAGAVSSAQISLVDLGSAEKIETAARQWLHDLTDIEASETSWKALSELFSPLQKCTNDSKKIWVCPDSELARIPWHLLFKGEQSSNIDGARLISQIDSLRELSLLKTRSKSIIIDTPPTVLVAGGIDFNYGADPQHKALMTFPLLPGSVQEKNDVVNLAKSAKMKVIEIGGAEATKDLLFRILPQANYVHLATHGYFFDDQLMTNINERVTGKTRSVVAMPRQAKSIDFSKRNPLVESGIALSGANQANQNPDDPQRRGLLTAEEFTGLDLSSCRLITLSACESGRGKETTGQGVLGLRASILNGGANTILMSLWKVPDAPTAILMKEFYENLWIRRMGKSEALSKAQESLLRQLPGNAKAPVNWAGWILVGESW